MRELGKEFIGAVIAEATLLNSDLIPKFESVLKNNYTEEELEEIDFQEVDYDTEDLEKLEGIDYYFEYLFNVLEEISPEGTSFGTHEGDGACYGFWQIEEEFMSEDDLPNEEAIDRLMDTLGIADNSAEEIDISGITFPVSFSWFREYVNNPDWKPFAEAEGEIIVADLALRKDLILITDCQNIQLVFESIYGKNICGWGSWGCIWVHQADGEIKEVWGCYASTPYSSNVVYLLYKLDDDFRGSKK